MTDCITITRARRGKRLAKTIRADGTVADYDSAFLYDLIERTRPKFVAVAFDRRLATSYRNEIYPQYKANREPAPPDLAVQFDYCRELCRRLGFAVVIDSHYEADDGIGTLAQRMRGQGVSSAFITRDKDLAQLVRDGDLYWDFGSRGQLGYRDVERRFGVAPERFADYLALTGDASDNIPGVPGIGPKTAAALMRAFGSIDELYAGLGRVGSLGLRGARELRERLREQASKKDPLAALSEQERRILELIGEGLTNRQIGERMYLAEKTVKNYVSNLLAKLDMQRRTQAAALAAQLKAESGRRSDD